MKEAISTLKNKIKSITDAIHKFSAKVADGFYSFLKKHDIIVYVVIVTILSFLLRYFLLDCVRGDYTSFLKPWYTRFYENGIKELGVTFGDYTPAYFYFMYFISLFKFDPESLHVLHAIKYFSIFFDYVMAVFSGLICYELTKNKAKSALCYTLVIFGLTCFLNSALWGQCDSIYSCFAVMSIYFLLRKRPNVSMIMLGLSFSFKLQAVFILPIIILLFLRRKFNLKYLLWIPVVYIILAIPASCLSSNFIVRFGEIMSIYFNQAANSYKQLTLNAGTFYALIFTNFKEEDYIATFALFLAIVIIGTYLFFIYRSKQEFTRKTWIKAGFLMLMITPYFLPHMHERYFYLVDVGVIIYALMNPKKFYVAIMVILNSMIGYMVYLWNIPFINVVPQEQMDATKAMSFRFGTIIYLIAIIIVSVDLFKELYPEGLKEEKKIEEEKTNG